GPLSGPDVPAGRATHVPQKGPGFTSELPCGGPNPGTLLGASLEQSTRLSAIQRFDGARHAGPQRRTGCQTNGQPDERKPFCPARRLAPPPPQARAPPAPGGPPPLPFFPAPRPGVAPPRRTGENFFS